MAFLRIIRPFNCIFVALTVLFGAYFQRIYVYSPEVIAAVAAALLIAAGGYVINDFYDVESDKINRPDRVLPSSKMKIRTAFYYAFTLFFLGFLSSLLTRNIICVIIAALNIIILFFYSKACQHKPLSGNLMVAYSAASTFLFGGLSNRNVKNCWIIVVFAFLYTLVREFIKDAEDIEGDQRVGARTLAIIAGTRGIVNFAIIPAFLIFLFNGYLLLTAKITPIIFYMINLLVIIPLVLFFFILYRGTGQRRMRIVTLGMKFDMLILLVILWIG